MTARSTEDFLPVVTAQCGERAVIRRLAPWIVVDPSAPTPAVPAQGWKLHVSAQPSSAHTILDRCLPVLRDYGCRFKVAESPQVVSHLNIGIGGVSQIGKFITVYPATDADAVEIAIALDAATRGLPGPTVPSDRRLRHGSLVHYRYGSFGGSLLQLPDGTVVSALMTPGGALVPDERHGAFNPPEWAIDPFPALEPAGTLAAVGAATGHTRYRAITLLSDSGRGSVLLGLDVIGRRRCIFKTADRAHGPGADDTVRTLRNEAAMLQQLAPETGRPAFYDLLELRDHIVLVMEDIPGRILAEHVADLVLTGQLPGSGTVARLGQHLAAMLSAIHRAGFVYRDLKSSNILVGPDGGLRLIDFELTGSPGTGPRGVGTRGYMSPQQWAGEPSTHLDDVYGLGAVLYFLATAADPCRAPDARDLLTRPVRLLNPSISEDLDDIIAECLVSDPRRRPASMALLGDRLGRSADATTLVRRPRARSPHDPDADRSAGERCAAFARRLGDTLCDEAVPTAHGGVTWTSTVAGSLPIPYRQINNGVPGAVLALAELWRAFGVERHRDTLVRGCIWLADSQPLPGARIAGLYAGEAGVGAALLRAGQVLGDEHWVAAACRCEARLREYPFAMPDLFHGTAGRLRFVMLLWDHTREGGLLEHAARCADQLLAEATAPNPDELCWTIGAGHGGFSGVTEPSYAHGTSGIADALLDLFELTGEPILAAAAVRAARWVEHQAVVSLPDHSGLDWGHNAGFSGLWCYGASGAGRLFLRLSDLRLMDGALDVAERAGRTVAAAGRHVGTSRCHGLAGSIEYLLDLHERSGRQRWLTDAWLLAELLQCFHREANGQTRWLSDDGDERGHNAYMVGYSGVAMTLLRLWDLNRFPHQLTLAGFRSQESLSPTSSRPPVGSSAAADGQPDECSDPID